MITRLSDIIDTGSQAEILAFFVTATPRSFSAPELSRRLNINSNAVSSATADLVKQNILKTFSKNRTTFYLLNQKNVLIPQLRESFKGEHKPWPDELSSSIKKLGSLSGIFLSGVFVGRPELVVDLLLVGSVNDAQLTKFLKTTSKQFGGELNYSIMSPAEFVMRRDTFDRFIKDIFDYPHVVLLDKSNAKAKPAVITKPRVVKQVTKRVVKSVVKKPTKKVVKKPVKKVAKKVQVKNKAKRKTVKRRI